VAVGVAGTGVEVGISTGWAGVVADGAGSIVGIAWGVNDAVGLITAAIVRVEVEKTNGVGALEPGKLHANMLSARENPAISKIRFLCFMPVILLKPESNLLI
jgi:hypothetical protein